MLFKHARKVGVRLEARPPSNVCQGQILIHEQLFGPLHPSLLNETVRRGTDAYLEGAREMKPAYFGKCREIVEADLACEVLVDELAYSPLLRP